MTDISVELGCSLHKVEYWLKKYKITSLPTILLRGDLEEYQVFLQIWNSVGTKEADGTYVFRETGQKEMGTYKDLKTGDVIPQEIFDPNAEQ